LLHIYFDIVNKKLGYITKQGDINSKYFYSIIR